MDTKPRPGGAIESILVVGVVLAASAAPAAHADHQQVPVTIRLYPNVRQVPLGTERIAGRVLRDADVAPVWIVMGPREAAVRVAPNEIIVRILEGRGAVGSHCGEAVVLPHASGQLITLFAACLTATAERLHLDPAIVWGHVLAHEAGHLLVRRSHGPLGIMAEVIDWRLARIGVLRFLPGETAAHPQADLAQKP